MILFNIMADVNKFLEILAKISIVAAYILIIMVTFGISVFIFWTMWFYPYSRSEDRFRRERPLESAYAAA